MVEYDGEYVLTKDGGKDFGEIPESIVEFINTNRPDRVPLKAGHIRLRIGTNEKGQRGFGQKHIERTNNKDNRLKQINDNGFENARDLVQYVAQNYDAIYPGKYAPIMLVKYNGKTDPAICVELSVDGCAAYFDTATGFVIRHSYFKHKKPLWELIQSGFQTSGSVMAPTKQTPRSLGDPIHQLSPHSLKKSSGRNRGFVKVAFRKTSLVDYPGKIAAVIFFPFCNLRCPWCHNGELISGGPDAPGLIPLSEALAHIERRRAMLGGVVLSGGEPTLFAGLPDLIEAIKKFGLSVKLDTNGMRPQVLREILCRAHPDFIALDLKLAPERYVELGGEDGAAANITESAAIINGCGVEYEMRSIALPNNYFGKADIDALAPLASAPDRWSFRPFRPGSCLDPAWNDYEESAPAQVEELASYAAASVVKLLQYPR
jgi:pyruvate formate lyase activating enzyme